MIRIFSRNNILTKTNFSLKRIDNFRKFSQDSHDDFKPKIKVDVPEGLREVIKLIDTQVKENSIMLYMKGTPARPQCGFSMQAVRILNALGVEFSSVNVLDYPLIRQEIKNYSDWPTIPQLYIKGEFIGGSDIMTSMFNDGALQKLIEEKKLI
jgi:monothiol glutaredoxin